MNRRTFSRLVTGAALATRLPANAESPTSLTPCFSCMLWTLESHASFERCLEIVAGAGYNGVELVGEFHDWSPRQTTQYLAKLQSLKLVVDAVSGVKAGFAVPSESGLFQTQFEQQLGYAKQLACPQIILLSGKRISGVAAEAQYETAIENLMGAAGLAAKQGVGILIEPIDALEDPNVFLTSVTDAFEMVREVNRPNLKVLYDLYHEQRGAGNLIEKLGKNIDLVGLIHIADVPGRHEPGTGEIDYSNVYRTLAKLRYDRFIAMEFYPTSDPTQALRRARSEVEEAYAAPIT